MIDSDSTEYGSSAATFPSEVIGFNTHSHNYFKHEFLVDEGGRAHVVTLSQFRIELQNPSQQLNPTEVKYHLDCCLLASKLSHGECHLLTDVLQQTMSIVTDHMSSKEMSTCKGKFKSTAIATTPELIHLTYVRG
jgi:hypothetical protein